MAYKQRGLSENQDRMHQQVIRDTRSLSMRISDSIKEPLHVAVFTLCIVLTMWIMPYLSDLLFLLVVVVFLMCFFHKASLPFRMPQTSDMFDASDPVPGNKDKFRKGRGIYFFGNSNDKDQEMWFGNDDMRTHCLIFGSTGSGKTQALISISYNALLQSSGFIYVDGKGDNSLFASVFSMVRSMGRDDDLLLINFMTGARDVIGPQERRLSNTLNPFAVGSSSMLAQLIVGLMGSSSKSGDGDMWKNRAIGFVEALMRVLVAMRDAGHILLDAHTIRNYFLFERLETMVMDKLFIRDGKEPVNIENLPSSVMEPIDNYVYNLPGYNKEKKGKQVSQVLEQHGYITMQLTRAFTSLADTYGHIMRTRLAEVDLKDVVLNRRILCVLLPALEKSPDELANLGKIIISSLKAMMAAGLGDHVEGEYQDLIDSKPTNAPSPYLCILDEYGYYAVEGFAVVPAQARSLGFSVVFAGQDLPAFQKASKEEAASIGANTNIKICMKLEDPTETWDFFMKSAGESYVTQVDNFQVDQGSMMGTYQDAKGARIEKRARIDLLDLKEQREGEAHFFFKSKIVRGRFFYANPKPTKILRLNHFLMVDAPDDAVVKQFLSGLSQFQELLEKGVDFSSVSIQDQEYQELLDKFQLERDEKSPLERAMAALKPEVQNDEFADFFSGEMEDTGDVDHLDIFTRLQTTDHVNTVALTDNMDAFAKPLLNRMDVRDQVEYIQRLCGQSGQQAMNVAIEFIADIERSTHYAPMTPPYSGSQLASLVTELANDIVLMKEE